MPKLIATTHINAPVDRVWEIMADFGAVYVYNPSVSTSVSTNDIIKGVGATRHCDLSPMGSVEEKIIDWNEGSGYTIEIYDSANLPQFKRSFAHLRIEAEDDGTKFTATLDYELKMGILDKLGARKQFARTWQRFAAGLKAYAENGVEVKTAKDVEADQIKVTIAAV